MTSSMSSSVATPTSIPSSTPSGTPVPSSMNSMNSPTPTLTKYDLYQLAGLWTLSSPPTTGASTTTSTTSPSSTFLTLPSNNAIQIVGHAVPLPNTTPPTTHDYVTFSDGANKPYFIIKSPVQPSFTPAGIDMSTAIFYCIAAPIDPTLPTSSPLKCMYYAFLQPATSKTTNPQLIVTSLTSASPVQSFTRTRSDKPVATV